MKKLTAVLLAAAMLLTLASCKNTEDSTPETTQQITATQENQTYVYSENQTQSAAGSATEAATQQENEETTLSEKDPSEWSAEETVDFYKAAASKSKTKVKSVQKMTLKTLSVNDGDGALGKLVELITPFMVSALEKNSTEFDGITGGYENLTAADTSSVKAYKEGNYTVVEMTLKEQTDGVKGDSNSGTVGHAISVVGDISVVEEELPQFEIGFDKATVSLRYANPVLKVKINKDGIIESGEWSYTVCVNIANLRVDAKRVPLGATVDKGYGEVDYLITVG